MVRPNLNLTSTSFFLPLFFVFFICISIHAQDDVCANVNCGEGTCVPSSTSILKFDCVCDLGWKKAELGFLTSLACLVPNCTLNFLCGNDTLPPFPLPSFNNSDPCNLVWCGDGSCVANGTEHYCECKEGAVNLLNNTASACLNPCVFGADCSELGFGAHVTTPPGAAAAPPKGILPPPLPPKGTETVPNKSWRSDVSSIIWLSAILLSSVL